MFHKGLDEEEEATSDSDIAQWRPILRRWTIDAYRQQRRWQRDRLSLTSDGADGDQWADGSSVQALDAVEWHCVFEQILNTPEACVMDQIYWQAATQRQAATICVLSQTSVRRVHQHALAKLRRSALRY